MEINIEDYISLLIKFPKDKLGVGLEPSFEKSKMDHQPMTYAIIISSETLHYMYLPNEDSKYRIIKGVDWLINNSDKNNDGCPGWGLPQPWDAFSDGSINPAHHPYTITTAFVIKGLIDAISLKSFWSETKLEKIYNLLRKASLFWCNKVWTGDQKGGYFWYSISSNDNYFVPNVSAMFLGSLVELITECEFIFTTVEINNIKQKIDRAAKAVIENVNYYDDMPFWNYSVKLPIRSSSIPNDLVHHIYILWGMEKYRYLDSVSLPWSLEKAVKSIDSFYRANYFYAYPQFKSYLKMKVTLRNRPARLWGIGMALAFYGKNKKIKKVEKVWEILKSKYNYPDLRLWPIQLSSDKNFYPRFAAHVLYGLSHNIF